MTATRRLAAILAADVAAYSRLIGEDEEGTLNRLRSIRTDVIEPRINENRGRIVKTTGDGLLVEFASVVDALRCATQWQHAMRKPGADISDDNRIEFRIGVHQGDIVVEDDDIFGDGVNVAARLEGLAEPGGICVSARIQEDVAGRLDVTFDDLGEQNLKNIARPVRVYRVRPLTAEDAPKLRPTENEPALTLPDKPSIAVLPFQNMSGDPEQEYFADGMVEEIITALSRIRWLFVIARNSSFTYKGKFTDVKQVGRELGVRYVLEGSVRRAAGRVRITAQLIEAATSAHLWADRFDGSLENVFELQDKVAISVAGVIEPMLQVGFARGWFRSGLIRIYAGQPDLAIEHLETSMRLSPRERIGTPLQWIGKALFFKRQFPDAASKLLISIQENPGSPTPYRALAACYAHMGRLNEARAAITKLRALTHLVWPSNLPYRNPEDHELFLSGLRIATGDVA